MLKEKIQCPKHQATMSSSSTTLLPKDWTNLTEDILDEIMKKMCYVDLSTIGEVCKSWRLMYINRFCYLPRNIPLGVPILLLNACEPDSNSRKFVKMSGELASDEIFMPEATNKWVCGSSWGWLVLASTDGMDVSLLNLLTRRVIQLPSIDTVTMRLNYQSESNVPLDSCRYIRKAILSTNLAISDQECIIMTIVGETRQLSYCRIGDTKWTNVKGCLPGICDVIYYQGKFYATNEQGVLMSCDIMDPNSIEIVAMGLPIDSYFISSSGRKYLVMALGHLLLVCRREKYNFEVHLLNKRNSPFVYHYLGGHENFEAWYEWVKIDSIGDQLLFVGNNDSFSLPAPRHSGRADCIYFTEDVFGRLQNHIPNPYIGMYDIAKKSACLYNEYARHELLPSFWVTPTPW